MGAPRIRFRITKGSIMARWSFLTNHATVFFFLAKHQLITGRELSGLIGITERTVRKIVSDLESAGYINRSREGRQVRYKINKKGVQLLSEGFSPQERENSRQPWQMGS
jgi:DNA-binding MarR family transcriptional regulator